MVKILCRLGLRPARSIRRLPWRRRAGESKGRERNSIADQRGFTLLELMVVVTIAGILVTIAEPSFLRTVTKAKEAALKQNLFTLRDTIDQYRADHGVYPPSIAELKETGYLKRIPIDPFTRSDGAWQEIQDESEGGVFDIHSGSDLVALDGTPYNQW